MRIRWTCPALKMHTRIQNTLSKLYEDTAVFFLETLSPGNRNDQSIAVVPQTLCEATFYHVFTLNYRYTLQPYAPQALEKKQSTHTPFRLLRVQA